MPVLRHGLQVKTCVRGETRHHVSILNPSLNRDRAFLLHPIKEDIERALVDVNGLVAKTIVRHQLTAAEISGDRCAAHSIKPNVAIRQLYPRNPRGLWDVNGVFHRSGAIGEVTRHWWRGC